MRHFSLLVLLVPLVAGCASRGTPSGDAGPARVTVIVHNPTSTQLPAQVCAYRGCSESREIGPGASSRFHLEPGSGTRAVVTTRLESRVANFPVDYTPGETLHVELRLP
jgi:hypothetical protein